MEEKNKYVETYITNIGEQLARNGIKITDNQLSRVINRFSNSDKSIEEIQKEINILLEEFLENYSKMLEAKQLQDLQLPFNGITLNNQDIDLMLIAGANNPQELQEALSKITNIRLSLNTTELTEEQFVEIRQQVYNMYLDTLTSRNDYIKNRKIELGRKIEYLKLSGILSSEEIATLDNVISSSRNTDEIVEKLNQSFSSDKVHRMYEIIRDFTPIEKAGIKSSTLEASRNLLEEIKNNYNSITIDEEAKYGKVTLQDGSFNFKHLQKALDFAKAHNKQVRLNTLLFYMDCPDELYNLEKTPENKMLVKQKLQSYVEATTRFIVDNGYSDTVRSIDVFNELLNRFAMTGETPYMYRGDIPQTQITMPNGELGIDDNIKSGWLKHLDISDLCDVIAVARKNMPTTDFMYNDDHLIDPKKIAPTIELIKQIRENEKRLGVKLIDSIGTQMHVDNGMTKEQMREMIINLSQFGLPIEITEFDIVITNGVENLSEEQIETIRQAKINEIYECVDELREQYNIRGFTIWSKTDKQNFRVFLANEERIPKGLEPIETMHGGYYTELMQPRNKTLTKSNFQSFNYHTHTNRCGHAGIASDKEYVEYAKQVGITQLGFTDHVPYTSLEFPETHKKSHIDEKTKEEVIDEIEVAQQRMHISDVDEYIASIRELQQENPTMKIMCGFEAEFDPMKEQFLGELRDKVDYMILGQHFVPYGMSQVPQRNNPNYPIQYAEMLCKAMESGIFDIVAHPDIFMEFRDSLDTEEKKTLFMQNAKIASQAICNKAKELGIPIELNFGGINKGKIMQDGQLAYPHSEFWQIAAETGVSVLYGVDAHTPEQFITMGKDKEKADMIIEPSKLNLVDKNYNPVEARRNNKRLQELYQQGQSKALTYETHLISQITAGIIDRIPEEEFNPDTFSYMSEYALAKVGQDSTEKASKIDGIIVKKIEVISNDVKLTPQEKAFQLKRTKNAIGHTNDTLSQQQSALERARESIHTSIEMGCQSKQDFKNITTQLTEGKTTKSNERRSEISNNLQTVQLANNQTTKKEQTKGPVLVKKINSNNNSNSNSNGNKGFINTITLSLIITFVCGIAVGIGYMLYKISIG